MTYQNLYKNRTNITSATQPARELLEPFRPVLQSDLRPSLENITSIHGSGEPEADIPIGRRYKSIAAERRQVLEAAGQW